MRSFIQVFSPVTTKDTFGSATTTWVSEGYWRAERTRYSGKRTNEGDERFPDFTVCYNVRIEHRCQEHWRIGAEDGRLYDIVAIEPTQWLGMQTLICERINL